MRWLLLAVFVAGGCSSSGSTANGDAGALVEDGVRFVDARQCPMCHQGNKGTLAGDTTAVAGTFAYSSNLTPDRTTGIGGWADEDIIRAIRYGYDDQNVELCPTMPRFDSMSDQEAQSIVAYLRSLRSVTHEIPESYCPPVKPPPGPDMAMPDM